MFCFSAVIEKFTLSADRIIDYLALIIEMEYAFIIWPRPYISFLRLDFFNLSVFVIFDYRLCLRFNAREEEANYRVKG